MILLLVLAQMFHDSWYGAVRVGNHTAAAQKRCDTARQPGSGLVWCSKQRTAHECCAVVEKALSAHGFVKDGGVFFSLSEKGFHLACTSADACEMEPYASRLNLVPAGNSATLALPNYACACALQHDASPMKHYPAAEFGHVAECWRPPASRSREHQGESNLVGR